MLKSYIAKWHIYTYYIYPTRKVWKTFKGLTRENYFKSQINC